MNTIPPGCWLGFGAFVPKDQVLARAATFFQCSTKDLVYKWTHGAWLVRPKSAEDEEE